MRVFSEALHAAMLDQSTGKALIPLIELLSPSMLSPLRFARNNENITSNGDVFFLSNFDVELPEEDGQVAGIGELTMENLSGSIVRLLKNEMAVQELMTCQLYLVLSTELDTRYNLGIYDLRNVRADTKLGLIKASLVVEDLLSEQSNAHVFNPFDFPGIL